MAACLKICFSHLNSYMHSLAPIMKSHAKHTHASNVNERVIRGNQLVLCVARQSHCFTNGNDVGLRINFATADCGSVSADCRCCYAVLRSARNSSKCHFLFVDRSESDRRNLFLEIGRDTLATSYRTAFLLFAALVQHARWPGRVRCRNGESPW